MTTKTGRKVDRPRNPPASNRAKSGTKAAKKNIRTLSERTETRGKAIMIHAEQSVGKTVLAIKEAPRPLLVLDCDNGLDSVMGMVGSEEVYVWEPSNGIDYSYEDMDEFRNYVKAGKWEIEYATIVVDNVTAAQKPFIRHSIDEAIRRMPEEKRPGRDPDIPTQQDWGKIYRMMDKWIVDIRDAKRRGTHVIFTAGTREWLDENAGFLRLFPNLEGQERNQIATHMDAVGYLEIEDDQRKLHLAPNGAIVTKVRLPVDRHDHVPDEIINPDFNKMMAAVKKGQEGGVRKPRPKATTKKTTRPTKK